VRRPNVTPIRGTGALRALQRLAAWARHTYRHSTQILK
jgi:hypothetical protein